MTRFWISWYSSVEPTEDLPFDAWISGTVVLDDFSDGPSILCAVIDAEDETAAYDIARRYYPDLQTRFCVAKEDDFKPGDRFQK